MNWSGNFREGLAREIRENKTLAKITAYTVLYIITPTFNHWLKSEDPFEDYKPKTKGGTATNLCEGECNSTTVHAGELGPRQQLAQ